MNPRGEPRRTFVAGASVARVKAALAEGGPFDLEGLRAGGQPVPGAESVVERVEV